MQFLRSIMFLTFGLVSWIADGWAAQIYSNLAPCSSPAGCTWSLEIVGNIIRGDYDKVLQVLAVADLDQTPGKSMSQLVRINSPGGSIDEAMKIGRLLRSRELGLVVPSNASCISACVLVLAGAVIRGPFGRVGIHRPFFEELDPSLATTDIDRAYKAMFAEIRSYLAEMNVPTELADAMEAIPPEEIRYLDDNELTKYLLAQNDPAYHESQVSRSAALYGISMDLYRERDAQANADCSYQWMVSNGPKWVTCTMSRLWGLSEDEYTRRASIWGPIAHQLKGATREKKISCQIAILRDGKKSCN